ncbi:hypothetical protein MMC27_003275 [Xylographa pallens]|nr:hypothetical protein [Xylographa pallens]
MAPYTDDQRLCLLRELDAMARNGVAQQQSARQTNIQLNARLQDLETTHPGVLGYKDWIGRRVEGCFRTLEKAYRPEFRRVKKTIYEYGSIVLDLGEVFEDPSYTGSITSIGTLQQAVADFQNAANASIAAIPTPPAIAVATNITTSINDNQNGTVGTSTNVGGQGATINAVGNLTVGQVETFASILDDLLVACNAIIVNLFAAAGDPQPLKQLPSPSISAIIAVFIITEIMEADLPIRTAITDLMQAQGAEMRRIEGTLFDRAKLNHRAYCASGPTHLAVWTHREIAARVEEQGEHLKSKIAPLLDQSGLMALKHTYDTLDDQLDDLVAAYVLRKYRMIE